MIWAVLILIAGAAAIRIKEHNRRVMDDTARGAGPGRFARLPQGVTHYEWSGAPNGPVVICVHGLTTPSFVWRGLIKGLGLMGYRVLTYDLFGRGFSDRPKGKQDAPFFLRQLGDLLTHEDIAGKFTLIGYSMGGAISTCFAAAHPERVRRLILLAPAGIQHNVGPVQKFIRDTPVLGDLIMLAVSPSLLRKGIKAERAIPSSVLDVWDLQEAELDFKGYLPSVLASFRGILSGQLGDEHQKIKQAGIPVLAIWGQADATIPLSAMGKLTEWNRSARQEMVEGAGHGLPYTHTQHVIEIIGQWEAERETTPS